MKTEIMKRLKRNAVIAVAVVMSLLLLTACGGKNNKDAFAAFAGTWTSETHPYVGLEINEDGNWELYKNAALYSSGELDYHSEDDSVWISPENNTQWSQLYIEDDGSLYIAPLGSFHSGDVSINNIPKVEKEWDEDSGDDWRSSGDVVASGTITREDGSVDVLVTVDEHSAAFYWDEPEQILFDSVSFPMTIPDAQEYFNDISFDDINGDGESDVSLGFVYAPGDSTSLIWIWDPEERYVFREDLSVLTTNSGDISEYVGLWEYVDEDVWLRIYEDEAWEFLNNREVATAFGSLSVDSTGITLYFDDTGEVVMQLDRTVSSDLIDSESGGLLVPADSISSNNSGGISEYTGLWEYPDGTILEIDDDWWYLYEADEYAPFAWGPVEYDEEAAYLMNDDGSSGGGKVYFDEDGNLHDTGYVLTYRGLHW